MQHRFRLRIAHSTPGVDARVRVRRAAALFLAVRNSELWDRAAKQWWLAAAPTHAAAPDALSVDQPSTTLSTAPSGRASKLVFGAISAAMPSRSMMRAIAAPLWPSLT